MAEIEKLINKQCDKYELLHRRGAKDSLLERTFSAVIKAAFKAGANFMLSHLNHENRWRKISEELPSVHEEKYQIVLRIIGLYHSSTVWTICNKHDIDMFQDATNCEWKPID